VVGGTVGAAGDEGEFGHFNICHGIHQLRAVPPDRVLTGLAAVRKSGRIDQKHDRNIALAAQLNKVRAFRAGLGRDFALRGDDAYLEAFNAGKAASQCLSVQFLEFLEAVAID
jgi:hypothetical protein